MLQAETRLAETVHGVGGLGLRRLENTAIYERLSHQEAGPALAQKPGGTFTAGGCPYY